MILILLHNMSKDTYIFDLKDIVKCLSYSESLITVETKYLERDEPVCVLRCMTDLPSCVEAVRVPNLGEIPLWKRERFCYCDGVSSLILYEEEGFGGRGNISVEEGIDCLETYIEYCVDSDYDFTKNRYLFK